MDLLPIPFPRISSSDPIRSLTLAVSLLAIRNYEGGVVGVGARRVGRGSQYDGGWAASTQLIPQSDRVTFFINNFFFLSAQVSYNTRLPSVSLCFPPVVGRFDVAWRQSFSKRQKREKIVTLSDVVEDLGDMGVGWKRHGQDQLGKEWNPSSQSHSTEENTLYIRLYRQSELLHLFAHSVRTGICLRNIQWPSLYWSGIDIDSPRPLLFFCSHTQLCWLPLTTTTSWPRVHQPESCPRFSLSQTFRWLLRIEDLDRLLFAHMAKRRWLAIRSSIRLSRMRERRSWWPSSSSRAATCGI